jgi:hypothetical protein
MSVTLSSKLKLNVFEEKGKLAAAAGAVGMWEARGFLRACRHFHSSSPFPNRHWLQDQLVAIEARQQESCKMNIPVAIVDRFHADGLSPKSLADENLCAFPYQVPPTVLQYPQCPGFRHLISPLVCSALSAHALEL